MNFLFGGLLDYNGYKQQLEKVKPASSGRNLHFKKGISITIIDMM